MNTVAGIIISIIAGAALWGFPRIFFSFPSWGVRIFWIALVLGLMASMYVPSPQNMAVMGVLAGMAVFEHLYQRYGAKIKARFIPPDVPTPRKKKRP